METPLSIQRPMRHRSAESWLDHKLPAPAALCESQKYCRNRAVKSVFIAKSLNSAFLEPKGKVAQSVCCLNRRQLTQGSGTKCSSFSSFGATPELYFLRKCATLHSMGRTCWDYVRLMGRRSSWAGSAYQREAFQRGGGVATPRVHASICEDRCFQMLNDPCNAMLPDSLEVGTKG